MCLVSTTAHCLSTWPLSLLPAMHTHMHMQRVDALSVDKGPESTSV